jgi:hypothetical protein
VKKFELLGASKQGPSKQATRVKRQESRHSADLPATRRSEQRQRTRRRA